MKRKSFNKSRTALPLLSRKPKIVVVLGPTASGKSALALAIAKKFNGEIISADSRQIYRGMDLGTAKPTLKERKGIPHYVLDIRNPDEPYTVAEYKRDATAAIVNVVKKRKLPVLVGGTGLYISAVIDNLAIPNIPPNPKLRHTLEVKIKAQGLQSVFRTLVKLDPEAACVVDAKNPRRVIRALEIALTTKKPLSVQRKKGPLLFQALKIGVQLSNNELRKRVNRRVETMIQRGLTGEVKGLVKQYGRTCAALHAIGYREITNYLDGTITLKEAGELIKKNTWAYTKRQMTWFKRDKEIHWVKNKKEAVSFVKKFV